MGPQNKSNRRGSKRTKYKGLYNDIERRRSFQPVVV